MTNALLSRLSSILSRTPERVASSGGNVAWFVDRGEALKPNRFYGPLWSEPTVSGSYRVIKMDIGKWRREFPFPRTTVGEAAAVALDLDPTTERFQELMDGACNAALAANISPAAILDVARSARTVFSKCGISAAEAIERFKILGRGR